MESQPVSKRGETLGEGSPEGAGPQNLPAPSYRTGVCVGQDFGISPVIRLRLIDT